MKCRGTFRASVPGGSRQSSEKGIAMATSKAGTVERHKLQPAERMTHFGHFVLMTGDDLDEHVLAPGYFNAAFEMLRRFDRISVTCTSDAVARGDGLGLAKHAELVVSRCERGPGGTPDVAVTLVSRTWEHADDAPRIDGAGRPIARDDAA